MTAIQVRSLPDDSSRRTKGAGDAVHGLWPWTTFRRLSN
jgi:hypothetical protein